MKYMATVRRTEVRYYSIEVDAPSFIYNNITLVRCEIEDKAVKQAGDFRWEDVACSVEMGVSNISPITLDEPDKLAEMVCKLNRT